MPSPRATAARSTISSFPLLTHLYFRSGDIRIFINAGPFFGYQLGESATSSGEANMSALDSTRHGMAVRDRFFWGLGGGPGISIPIGKRQRVELEGRFVYGLATSGALSVDRPMYNRRRCTSGRR